MAANGAPAAVQDPSVVAEGPTNYFFNNVESTATSGHTVNSLPSYMRPIFLIKYGPPGSGKSSADKLIETFGVPIDQYVNIALDDMVTSVRSYRRNTQKLYKRYTNEGKPFNTNFYAGINTAFAKAKNTKNALGLSIDEKRKLLFQKSIDLGKNIIFETTGSSSKPGVDYLAEFLDAVPPIYQVILIYPVVKADILQGRVRGRAEAQLRLPEPYFRIVNPDTVPVKVENSVRYFHEFLVRRLFDDSLRIINKMFVYRNDVPETDNKELTEEELEAIVTNASRKTNNAKRISNKPVRFTYRRNKDGKVRAVNEVSHKNYRYIPNSNHKQRLRAELRANRSPAPNKKAVAGAEEE
jgi:hypothetical protein